MCSFLIMQKKLSKNTETIINLARRIGDEGIGNMYSKDIDETIGQQTEVYHEQLDDFVQISTKKKKKVPYQILKTQASISEGK